MGQTELAKTVAVLRGVRRGQTILVDRCVGKDVFLRG